MLLCGGISFAQSGAATTVRHGASLPATCQNQIFLKDGDGFYVCGNTPNIWAKLSNLVDYQKATAAVTAISGTDVTIYSTSVPGGTFGAGHGIIVDAFVNHAGGASGAFKIFYGATSITVVTSSTAGNYILRVVIANDPGATNSQQITALVGQASNAVAAPAAPVAAAIDSTTSQTVKLTFNVANSTDTATPKLWMITKF